MFAGNGKTGGGVLLCMEEFPGGENEGIVPWSAVVFARENHL